MNRESVRKWICIPAYIIVAVCALLCAYSGLDLPGKDKINMNLMYLNSDNKTVKTVVNIILLIAALTTLGCALSWCCRK